MFIIGFNMGASMKIKIDIDVNIKEYILVYLYYRPKNFIKQLMCEIKGKHKYKICGMSGYNGEICHLALCVNCMKEIKVNPKKYPIACGVFNKVEELK